MVLRITQQCKGKNAIIPKVAAVGLQIVAETVVICGMSFLERVLSLARERRFSQRELARRIGVDPSRITEWKRRAEGERAGKGPSLEDALALAKTLDASVAYLVGEIATLKPESSLALDEEEQRLLWAIRGMRLGADEVLQRIERGGRGLDAPAAKPAPGERPAVKQDHPIPHPRRNGGSKTRRRTR